MTMEKISIKKRKTPYREAILLEKEGVPYFSFPALEETGLVTHLFTTRLGGVSEGIFSSMNLSSNRGDEKEKVLENYARVAKILGCEKEDFTFSDQTHTTNIRVMTEEDRGKGMVKAQDYQDIDGIITNVPGIALGTFYADCVPLYFLDPVKKVIGLSHSGWKGTVGKIGAKTIEMMRETYGSRPEDILVAVGPSICVDCYEVSLDVAEQFKSAFAIKQEETYLGQTDSCKHILYRKNEEKYQLDLWAAVVHVFLEAGILPEHISVSNVCTCCNPELLFSHRATHGNRGNLGAFMMLKKD